MSNQHVLKIHPAPLADLLSGAKTAEVRRNDRDFQVGDTVRLMEVNPETGNWTGAADQVCTITHIQTGYGLPDDLCVLSYGKVGHDYKAHWMGFMDRTDWMQEKGQVPAKYLGQHRADILTDMLREAREALVRVEAELSDIRHKAFTAAMARDTAQEQLAEAVRLMREVEPHKVSEELETLFRAFLAQAEQQEAGEMLPRVKHLLSMPAVKPPKPEAQGAQAGDERAGEFWKYADKFKGRGCFTWAELEDAFKSGAAIATQPAAGTTSDQYRAELYDEVWQNARSMGYGNVTDALSELERFKLAQAAAGKPAAVVEQTDYPYPVSSQIDVPLPVGTQLYTVQPAAVRGAEHDQ